MSKHTPGPWYFRDGDVCRDVVVDGPKRPEVVAPIPTYYRPSVKDDKDDDANGRLIAAAAELYEHLKWAMRHVENVFALAGWHDEERPQLEAARSVLKRIEGRSSWEKSSIPVPADEGGPPA